MNFVWCGFIDFWRFQVEIVVQRFFARRKIFHRDLLVHEFYTISLYHNLLKKGKNFISACINLRNFIV